MGGELLAMIGRRLDRHDPPVHRPHVLKLLRHGHRLDPRPRPAKPLDGGRGQFANGKIGAVVEESFQKPQPWRHRCIFLSSARRQRKGDRRRTD